MSEPLLSLSDGLFLAAEAGAEPRAVQYSLEEGGIKFAFRQLGAWPVFGRCGPLSDCQVDIEAANLLGLERRAEGTRVLYWKQNGLASTMKRTPFLVGTALPEVEAHVEATTIPQRRKLLVVVNPKSGKGNSRQLIEREALPIFSAAGADVDVVYTEAPKHATRIVREKDNLLSYHAILSAGGDGTFHELLAGLLARDDWRQVVRKVALLQIPCGSGNALAASSGHRTVPRAAYAAVRGTPVPLDVASILQPSTGCRMFSFLSVTFGLVANLDIGTEHLRWMGAQRFVWGAIREILGQRTYQASVSFRLAGADADASTTPASSSQSRYPELRALGALVADDGSIHPDGERRLDTSAWEHVEAGVGDGYQLFSMANLPWLDMSFNLHPESAPGSYNFVFSTGKEGIAKGFELMTAAEKGKHVEFEWVHQRQITAFAVRPIAEDSWLVVDGEAIERSTIFGEVHRGLVTRLV